MIPLRREQAPLPREAWDAIDEQAAAVLRTHWAARKLIGVQGPLGWRHSAVNLGRTQLLDEDPVLGVEGRLRRVQPLVELRVPFTLSREELEGIARGAQDADLDAVVQAARKLALAEDSAVFSGYPAAGIRGIVEGAVHESLSLNEDFSMYPGVIANATSVLRSAGVDGPYAIALGPRYYAGLLKTIGPGGFPTLHHVRQMLDGPVVWAPALDGAVVLSVRGDDFQLVVGQDVAIGYRDHDRTEVELYLEESLTFRLLVPEAAVPLVYPT